MMGRVLWHHSYIQIEKFFSTVKIIQFSAVFFFEEKNEIQLNRIGLIWKKKETKRREARLHFSVYNVFAKPLNEPIVVHVECHYQS